MDNEFVMAPKYPTREMIDAAIVHTEREDDEEIYRARGQAIAVYITMIAAFNRSSKGDHSDA